MRKDCGACGQPFHAQRASGKYCSERCKKRVHRNVHNPAEVVPIEPDDGSVAGQLEQSTRGELEAEGRLRSPSGEAALALARRIDAPQGETGSSMAALVREYRAVLADALKDVEQQTDPLDELRSRRERKLASG